MFDRFSDAPCMVDGVSFHTARAIGFGRCDGQQSRRDRRRTNRWASARRLAKQSARGSPSHCGGHLARQQSLPGGGEVHSRAGSSTASLQNVDAARTSRHAMTSMQPLPDNCRHGSGTRPGPTELDSMDRPNTSLLANTSGLVTTLEQLGRGYSSRGDSLSSNPFASAVSDSAISASYAR